MPDPDPVPAAAVAMPDPIVAALGEGPVALTAVPEGSVAMPDPVPAAGSSTLFCGERVQ